MTKPITLLPTKCIEWTGAHTKAGYGQVGHQGKTVYAHRLAYCARHGLDLNSIDGMLVRHACDNPPCVNPDHLSLGDHADNARDALERGRGGNWKLSDEAIKQAAVVNTKVTAANVEFIKRVYIPRHPEFSQTALAKRLGVHQVHIGRIVNGQRRVSTGQPVQL